MSNSGMFGASGSGDTSGFGGLVRAVQSPGSSERPYGSYFDEVADELERAFPEFNDAIEKVVVDRGELTLHIKRDRLVDVAMKLRDTDSLRFEMCLGVNGVHYPNETGRELHAIYPLLSITNNRRVLDARHVPQQGIGALSRRHGNHAQIIEIRHPRLRHLDLDLKGDACAGIGPVVGRHEAAGRGRRSE